MWVIEVYDPVGSETYGLYKDLEAVKSDEELNTAWFDDSKATWVETDIPDIEAAPGNTAIAYQKWPNGTEGNIAYKKVIRG